MNPNDRFFDNALDASCRVNDLEQFREYMDAYLKREQDYFREAHVDLEIEFLPLFSATFPPILHSSLVISSIMLIELEMRAFAEALREHLTLPLSMSDLQGSLVERFRKYVCQLAGLDLKIQNDAWADLIGIFEIRNCLVRNYGSLDHFSRRSIIAEFARRHSVATLQGDIILVDDAASEKVLQIASAFFDSIYGSALRHFPGQHNWPLATRPGA